MTLPKVADAAADYGLPDEGFANYLKDVTDPTTDWDASGASEMIADVAGMTRTVDRCWVRFVGNATTPTLAVTNGSDAVWGNDSGVLPTVAHQATGHYRVQWPTSIVDEFGDTIALNIRKARASVEGATPYWQPQILLVDTHTVDVYTFDTSHAANDLVGVTILLETG